MSFTAKPENAFVFLNIGSLPSLILVERLIVRDSGVGAGSPSKESVAHWRHIFFFNLALFERLFNLAFIARTTSLSDLSLTDAKGDLTMLLYGLVRYCRETRDGSYRPHLPRSDQAGTYSPRGSDPVHAARL